MINAIRLVPQTLRSRAAGTFIPDTYMGIGTPFDHPVQILKITNLTDAGVIISFNGIDDHEILLTNAFILIDTSMDYLPMEPASFAQMQRVYVKSHFVPLGGAVYVTSFYVEKP